MLNDFQTVPSLSSLPSASSSVLSSQATLMYPQQSANSGCPNCGYCPHCGRSNGNGYGYGVPGVVYNTTTPNYQTVTVPTLNGATWTFSDTLATNVGDKAFVSTTSVSGELGAIANDLKK